MAGVKGRVALITGASRGIGTRSAYSPLGTGKNAGVRGYADLTKKVLYGVQGRITPRSGCTGADLAGNVAGDSLG